MDDTTALVNSSLSKQPVNLRYFERFMLKEKKLQVREIQFHEIFKEKLVGFCYADVGHAG